MSNREGQIQPDDAAIALDVLRKQVAEMDVRGGTLETAARDMLDEVEKLGTDVREAVEAWSNLRGGLPASERDPTLYDAMVDEIDALHAAGDRLVKAVWSADWDRAETDWRMTRFWGGDNLRGPARRDLFNALEALLKIGAEVENIVERQAQECAPLSFEDGATMFDWRNAVRQAHEVRLKGAGPDS